MPYIFKIINDRKVIKSLFTNRILALLFNRFCLLFITLINIFAINKNKRIIAYKDIETIDIIQ